MTAGRCEYADLNIFTYFQFKFKIIKKTILQLFFVSLALFHQFNAVSAFISMKKYHLNQCIDKRELLLFCCFPDIEPFKV